MFMIILDHIPGDLAVVCEDLADVHNADVTITVSAVIRTDDPIVAQELSEIYGHPVPALAERKEGEE